MSDKSKVPRNVGGHGDGQDASHGGSRDDAEAHILRATSSSSSSIPATKPGRRLILCFDGTGNKPGEQNTNVFEFYKLLWRNEDEQPTYYQSGIGTTLFVIGRSVRASFTFYRPSKWKIMDILNQGFATNMKEHIMMGYQFLMDEYKEGDRICIFGFSRGAYTARSLAGMVNAVGLHHKVPKDQSMDAASLSAYNCYEANNEGKWMQFKEANCVPVLIDFVGVWDTVASVGISKALPFTESNPAIKTFRHALALDERRVKFELLHYTPTDGAPQEGDTSTSTSAPNRQVWFLGCHSNVGGGSVDTGTKHSLQRIALRWMVGECFDANTGIIFKEDALRELLEDSTEDAKAGTDPNSIKDELVSSTKRILWWFLEIVPTFNVASNRRFWMSLIPTRLPNVFRGRTIPKGTFKCHTSVKTRIDAKALEYVPQANLKRPPFLLFWRRKRRLDVSDDQWVDSELHGVRAFLGL